MDRCPYPSSRDTKKILGEVFSWDFSLFFLVFVFERCLRSFVGGFERNGMAMLLFMHNDMGGSS